MPPRPLDKLKPQPLDDTIWSLATKDGFAALKRSEPPKTVWGAWLLYSASHVITLTMALFFWVIIYAVCVFLGHTLSTKLPSMAVAWFTALGLTTTAAVIGGGWLARLGMTAPTPMGTTVIRSTHEPSSDNLDTLLQCLARLRRRLPGQTPTTLLTFKDQRPGLGASVQTPDARLTIQHRRTPRRQTLSVRSGTRTQTITLERTKASGAPWRNPHGEAVTDPAWFFGQAFEGMLEQFPALQTPRKDTLHVRRTPYPVDAPPSSPDFEAPHQEPKAAFSDVVPPYLHALPIMRKGFWMAQLWPLALMMSAVGWFWADIVPRDHTQWHVSMMPWTTSVALLVGALCNGAITWPSTRARMLRWPRLSPHEPRQRPTTSHLASQTLRLRDHILSLDEARIDLRRHFALNFYRSLAADIGPLTIVEMVAEGERMRVGVPVADDEGWRKLDQLNAEVPLMDPQRFIQEIWPALAGAAATSSHAPRWDFSMPSQGTAQDVSIEQQAAVHALP